MSVLTVRLPNDTINELDIIIKKLHISRSEYVRRSIEQMNESLYNKERKARLAAISNRVRAESMFINSEFDKIEYE